MIGSLCAPFKIDVRDDFPPLDDFFRGDRFSLTTLTLPWNTLCGVACFCTKLKTTNSRQHNHKLFSLKTMQFVENSFSHREAALDMAVSSPLLRPETRVRLYSPFITLWLVIDSCINFVCGALFLIRPHSMLPALTPDIEWVGRTASGYYCLMDPFIRMILMGLFVLRGLLHCLATLYRVLHEGGYNNKLVMLTTTMIHLLAIAPYIYFFTKERESIKRRLIERRQEVKQS
ncbi:hypothetical protein PROFUN_00097 [Planoprotostelium fungivorum]|uniref:Transmembrane protein n=1 Tax=Planoprotostelium fungivorum TaxID=1890364 RepID=A0A2P6P0M3_9EUKA|nr:hypothetical protein PROFUN_00097 [Planoprotostelium fungivorum]